MYIYIYIYIHTHIVFSPCSYNEEMLANLVKFMCQLCARVLHAGMYVCMYVYMYTHTHTHIYTYAHTRTCTLTCKYMYKSLVPSKRFLNSCMYV